MSTTQTYRVKGMHCVSCAAIIEKALKKVSGVCGAAVNYGTETAKGDFDAAPASAPATLFVVGQPYLVGLFRFLRRGKANMDTLIGLGTLAAYLYSFAITAFEESLRPFLNVEVTHYDVTIIVITFIALGKYLEARSKVKTGD